MKYFKKLLFFLQDKVPQKSHNVTDTIVSLYLVYFVFVLLYAIFLKSLDAYVGIPKHRAFAGLEGKSWYYVLLIGVVIVPIVEELVFRLILVPTKRNVLLSTFFISFFFINHLSGHGKYTLDKDSILIISACLIITVVTVKVVDKFGLLVPKGTHRNYLLFYSIVIFGLVHVGNLRLDALHHYLLFPVILLPQILLGLILSYLRCEFSLGKAMLFHGMVNLFPALIFTLSSS
ncbi:hypothetical protein GCM10028791_28620 [Echinicola sediminis]